ncbi:MAG: class I SAM-dependent methyltransferase, partial [Actinomycetota bacterium]
RERAELRAFYEQEAEARTRSELRGKRREILAGYLRLLADEGRHSVLDAGSGPGLDGAGFVAAGHRFVGVDLARGNGALARERGMDVVQGSVTALPIRPGFFDAGWSMSTLMHLTADDMVTTAAELAGALRPGAPAMIGLWGFEDEVSSSDGPDRPGPRRIFHLRSFEHNQSLLATSARIESAERLVALADGWDYHLIRLRTG